MGTRIENGVKITRLVVIPKNKYSDVYQDHKKRKDNKETFEVPVKCVN